MRIQSLLVATALVSQVTADLSWLLPTKLFARHEVAAGSREVSDQRNFAAKSVNEHPQGPKRPPIRPQKKYPHHQNVPNGLPYSENTKDRFRRQASASTTSLKGYFTPESSSHTSTPTPTPTSTSTNTVITLTLSGSTTCTNSTVVPQGTGITTIPLPKGTTFTVTSQYVTTSTSIQTIVLSTDSVNAITIAPSDTVASGNIITASALVTMSGTGSALLGASSTIIPNYANITFTSVLSATNTGFGTGVASLASSTSFPSPSISSNDSSPVTSATAYPTGVQPLAGFGTGPASPASSIPFANASVSSDYSYSVTSGTAYSTRAPLPPSGLANTTAFVLSTGASGAIVGTTAGSSGSPVSSSSAGPYGNQSSTLILSTGVSGAIVGTGTAGSSGFPVPPTSLGPYSNQTTTLILSAGESGANVGTAGSSGFPVTSSGAAPYANTTVGTGPLLSTGTGIALSTGVSSGFESGTAAISTSAPGTASYQNTTFAATGTSFPFPASAGSSAGYPSFTGTAPPHYPNATNAIPTSFIPSSYSLSGSIPIISSASCTGGVYTNSSAYVTATVDITIIETIVPSSGAPTSSADISASNATTTSLGSTPTAYSAISATLPSGVPTSSGSSSAFDPNTTSSTSTDSPFSGISTGIPTGVLTGVLTSSFASKTVPSSGLSSGVSSGSISPSSSAEIYSNTTMTFSTPAFSTGVSSSSSVLSPSANDTSSSVIVSTSFPASTAMTYFLTTLSSTSLISNTSSTLTSSTLSVFSSTTLPVPNAASISSLSNTITSTTPATVTSATDSTSSITTSAASASPTIHARDWCGVHGPPAGVGYMADYAFQGNAPITIEDCYEDCLANTECASYSFFYSVELLAPRCDLFNTDVEESVLVDENYDSTQVWYDIGCGPPAQLSRPEGLPAYKKTSGGTAEVWASAVGWFGEDAGM